MHFTVNPPSRIVLFRNHYFQYFSQIAAAGYQLKRPEAQVLSTTAYPNRTSRWWIVARLNRWRQAHPFSVKLCYFPDQLLFFLWNEIPNEMGE